MTLKQRKALIRIIAAAFFLVFAILLQNKVDIFGEFQTIALFGMYLIPYLIVGYDVLRKAIRNILRGKVFDENFLMGLATIGAILLKDYKEAVAVMLFYQVGELFQSYAVSKSRKSIAELMDIRPDYANIEVKGILKKVSPEEVKIGDTIVVKPGERVPLDGVIVHGSSYLDTTALTGESIPRQVMEGSQAISGCINKNGVLRIRVEKGYQESTVSRILDLVEHASSKKAKTENFITRFARYYTPMVVIAATLLALLPPLILQESFSEWVSRALIFLVISCPCALVISVPLGFFGGIGAASRNGILVKGSNYLEALAKVDTVVFDKTGTLTKGSFNVTECFPNHVSKQVLLELATLAEAYSDHPISLSLKRAYNQVFDHSRVRDSREIAGQGVKANIDGDLVLVGNEKLMINHKINYIRCDSVGTILYVSRNQRFLGSIVISDENKEDAYDAIQALKQAGVSNTVMLTGDRRSVAKVVASSLDIDTVYSELLPQDKVEKIEGILAEQKTGKYIAFVGDGINDAPVLSRADVGIAMGGFGADAAIEAADVVLMDDSPTKIATAIDFSRKTLRIVKQNIVFALGVKAFVLILGAFGEASMWDAVFADVGVSVIAILNSMRALTFKK